MGYVWAASSACFYLASFGWKFSPFGYVLVILGMITQMKAMWVLLG